MRPQVIQNLKKEENKNAKIADFHNIQKKKKKHKEISQEECIDTRIVPRQQTFGQSSGQYCFRATMEEAIDILGPIVSRRTSGRVYLAVSLEVTYQVE